MRRQHGIILALCFVILGTTPLWVTASEQSPDGVWNRITANELQNLGAAGLNPWVQPTRFVALRLAPQELDKALARAPMEFTKEARESPVIMTLPTPDGTYERFAVVVSPIMAPGLEAWMANQGWPMKTYRGMSLDNPATSLRLDWGGPAGFHASVLSPDGSYFIDPYWQGEREVYTTYFKHDYVKHDAFHCLLEGSPIAGEGLAKAGTSTNGNLRTYRLVVAATGEYTQFHGGTQVAGQAAIVTTMNRVNQIYERDVSIRMILVPDNINVVYTDGTTDPYTNDNGLTMLTENQTNCNAVIGSANYDMGHVVSTGGGGIATLRVPCTSSKARGVTGSGAPIGDPYDVDYVAHEMGHQWGAYHTFNSETGSCGGGNRSAAYAYEPGSGSTIMAYAGICTTNDLQPHSDAYFHGISLDQILNYSGGTGASCATNIAGVNPNPPTVDAGPGYTIPINTPFVLEVASSNDLDGDTLSYNWEQFDLGPATNIGAGDTGSGPILRSWGPATTTYRRFPYNGVTSAPGESLPSTNRTINFRVTARDNNSGGGRVGEDTVAISSDTSAGPFAVTSPNGGEIWSGNQTVTWNVASTNTGAVNTPYVDILLSLDGGTTWPITLIAGAPNDGSEDVFLPSVNTTAARIIVKGSGNVFYDMSNANFTIGSLPAITLYDQTGSCASGGSTSQYFSDFGGGSDTADDFVVPAGERWVVSNVTANGSFSSGGGPFTSVNMYIWSDSAGLPDTVVGGCSFPSQIPAGGLADPNVSLDLPSSCVLDPGVYWIQVQAVMPYGTNGQWFWKRASGPVGSEFAFRDLEYLFGLGCRNWSPQSGCLGSAETELCFSISGTFDNVIFLDGFESANTAAWSASQP